MPIQLSGSLVITGSITTTGVITMSGSIASASYSSTSDLLQGTGSVGFTITASFNAVSSSQQQISASYIALSGSYNTFSGSASTRITANSSSIQQVSSSQQQISASLLNVIAIGATTGSNSFRANQSITGSLVVSSTITAQTLVVQTVTSSIVYSSGSNIFGCDLNSRQTFTGSVLITGSLTIAGASSATSYSGTTIYGSTIACSPIGCFTTSCATSFIGGTGTLSGDLTLQGAVTRNIKFLDNANTNLNAQIQYDQISSTSGQLLFGTNNAGTFATRLTISNTGASTFSSTITGTTIYGSTAVCSPVGKFTSCIDAGTGYFGGAVFLGGFTYSSLYNLGIYGNASFLGSRSAPATLFANGGTDDSKLILQAGSTAGYLSKIDVSGWNGTGTPAYISLNAGSGTGIYINNGNNVGIGCTDPQAPLHIKTSNGCAIRLSYGSNGGYVAIDVDSANSLIFKAYIGTEYMRIACTGYVGIGTCNPGMPLELYVSDGTGLRLKNAGSADKRWDLAVSGNDLRINETGVGAVLSFKAGGNIGIGCTSPGYKIDVDGNAHFRADGATMLIESTQPTNSYTLKIVQCATGGNGNNDQGLVVQINAGDGTSNIANFYDYNNGSPVSRLKIQRSGITCFSNTICAPLIFAPGTPIQVVTGTAIATSGTSSDKASLGPTGGGTTPGYNCGCIIATVSFTPKSASSKLLIQTNNVALWETQNVADHFYLWASNDCAGTVLTKSGGYILNLGACTGVGTQGAIVNLNGAASSWGTSANTISFRIGTSGDPGNYYQWNPYYGAGGFSSATVGNFTYTIMEIAQ